MPFADADDDDSSMADPFETFADRPDDDTVLLAPRLDFTPGGTSRGEGPEADIQSPFAELERKTVSELMSPVRRRADAPGDASPVMPGAPFEALPRASDDASGLVLSFEDRSEPTPPPDADLDADPIAEDEGPFRKITVAVRAGPGASGVVARHGLDHRTVIDRVRPGDTAGPRHDAPPGGAFFRSGSPGRRPARRAGTRAPAGGCRRHRRSGQRSPRRRPCRLGGVFPALPDDPDRAFAARRPWPRPRPGADRPGGPRTGPARPYRVAQGRSLVCLRPPSFSAKRRKRRRRRPRYTGVPWRRRRCRLRSRA